MEYVIALGSSRMSASLLVRHILSEIGALADQLWQAFQVNARCLPHTCSSTSSWLSDNADPFCFFRPPLPADKLQVYFPSLCSFAALFFKNHVQIINVWLVLTVFFVLFLLFFPTDSLSLSYINFLFDLFAPQSRPLYEASGPNSLPLSTHCHGRVWKTVINTASYRFPVHRIQEFLSGFLWPGESCVWPALLPVKDRGRCHASGVLRNGNV